jgi:hypothetical protein
MVASKWSGDALAALRARALAGLSAPSSAEAPVLFASTGLLAPSSAEALAPVAASAVSITSSATLPPAAARPARTFNRAYKIAALTSRFRLPDLVTDPAERKSLEQDSVPLREPGTVGWRTLLPHIRKLVLAQIDGQRETAELLAAYSPGEDSFQKAVSIALAGLEESQLTAMTPAQLAVLAQYRDELAPLVPSLPPAVMIDRKLDLVRLLDPLKRITSTFAGRESELEQLRQYVGVLELETFLGKAARALETIFQIERKKPLLLHGIGGVGKTTLVAKFILDHAQAGLSQRFPFAYIDFDRPVVSGEEPVTILIEAIRQIALQYDESYDAAEELRERWQAHIRAGASRRRKRPDKAFFEDFAAFLNVLKVRDGPVLFVIDTFEEVQNRGAGQARRLVSFLSGLSELIPRMRVVIAGRADIPNASLSDRIALTAFDAKSAAAYLVANSVPADLAPAVVKHVGGSPLSLNLAVKLYRMDPKEFAIARLKETITHGQLVDRILLHIQDKDVQKLAHPGLALRRITPELIMEVLAEPCGLDVPTLARAEELFEILSREVSLVSPESERVLLHRMDVRHVMLGLLRDSARAKVQEIHRLAVAYYEKQRGVISRGEEIYHRLSLAQDHAEIAKRIIPGVGARLANAVDDLLAPEQAFLADKFGIPVPPEALKAADQETWERTAVRRVQELMSASDYEGAAAVLAERTARSASTDLRLTEATFLSATGRADDALAVARDGINAYDREGNIEALVAMLLVAGAIERQRENFDAAAGLLDSAALISGRRNDPLMELHILRDRVTLLRTIGERPDDELRLRIRQVAALISEGDWQLDLTLLRDVAAIVGDDDPSIVEQAARLGAIDFFADEASQVQRVATDANVDLSLGLESMIAENSTHAYAVRRAVVDVLDGDFALESVRGISLPPLIPSRKIKVTEEQGSQFAGHLARLYETPRRLADFVDSRVGVSVRARSFSRDVNVAAEALVKAAQKEGRIGALIDATVRANFDDEEVQRWGDLVGGGIQVVPHPAKTLPEEQLRAILLRHRRMIGEVTARTCAISSGESVVGSGFLINRAAVLTSACVAEQAQKVSRRPTVTFGTGYSTTGGKWRPLLEDAAILDLTVDVARISVPGHPQGIPHGFIRPHFRPIHAEPVLCLWNDGEVTSLTGVRVDLGQALLVSRMKPNAAGGPCLDDFGNVIGLYAGPSGKQDRLLPILGLQKALEQAF